MVIAVFGISLGSTGIWWYARTRSILEEIVEAAKVVVKSWMCVSTIIPTWTPIPRGFLRDHVEGGGPRAGGRANEACDQTPGG